MLALNNVNANNYYTVFVIFILEMTGNFGLSKFSKRYSNKL